MRELSSTNRSNSTSETPGETGDSATATSGKVFYQNLIHQANTVPISNVFKHYGLQLSEHNRKIVCPFKSHQGGRERTPSFNYYPDTNSYWCFGCRIGSHACDFVAEVEGISKAKAAYKILHLFKDSVGEEDFLSLPDLSERLDIMLNFSNTVREFRHAHLEEKDRIFIENICLVYDDLYSKHNSKTKKLDNAALKRIVEQLKEKITIYTSCHKP